MCRAIEFGTRQTWRIQWILVDISSIIKNSPVSVPWDQIPEQHTTLAHSVTLSHQRKRARHHFAFTVDMIYLYSTVGGTSWHCTVYTVNGYESLDVYCQNLLNSYSTQTPHNTVAANIRLNWKEFIRRPTIVKSLFFYLKFFNEHFPPLNLLAICCFQICKWILCHF